MTTTTTTLATMKTLRFGIEIETVGASRASLAQAIHSVVGGALDTWDAKVTDRSGRIWRVVADGSLRSENGNCGEIVSPILTYDDIEELQQIIRAVRAANGRVNESCGIHLHVGSEMFDTKSLVNLIKFVAKQEQLLEHALQISPQRLARYCRSIDPAFLARIEAKTPKTMEELRDAWYGYANAQPSRYDSSRYRTLNLNSHFFRGTVEVRAFNGTLHAGEIKAYIQLVLAMAAYALTAKAASSKRRAFDPATAKYDLRVLLLRLGMVGDEFKTARHHLTKHLAGSAAWKHGRRAVRAAATSTPAEATQADIEPHTAPAAIPAAA